jgi:hypothetical protein
MSKSVHFILQGKGGVGKSFISAILAQFIAKNSEVKCYDTDPVNQTFAAFKALNVKHIPLIEKGASKIIERNFDTLVEDILTAEDGIFVVDNGASTFVPMCNYIMENNLIQMLKDSGIEVYIHTIITGGQALRDTLDGLDSIFEKVSKDNVYVWLNHYFGVINIEGKSFIETAYYNKHKSQIKGVLNIEQKNSDTFGIDIRNMLEQNLTFDQVQNADSGFSIMAKQRLKQTEKALFEVLESCVS